MFADDDDKISFFFAAPPVLPSAHSRAAVVSTLYLLRREMMDCMGHNPNEQSEQVADEQGTQHRVFASLSLMFTTFDLLAKFMFGDGGGVGSRFRDFLRSPDGGGLDSPTAAVLWRVRNSMVHAFGLPSTDGVADLNLSAVSLALRKPATDISGGFQGLVVAQYDQGVASV